MGAPTLRSNVSKRSLINATPAPASGFASPGKDEMIVSFILARPADAGAEAAGARVAGAGGAVGTEGVGVAPVFGRNVPTSQGSIWGANLEMLPVIPMTQR